MSDFNILLEKIKLVSGHNKEVLLLVDNIKKNPSEYKYWKQLGDILLNKEQYTYADKCYDFAINLYPSSSSLYNKGLTLFHLGKYEESIIFFDKVIELDRENVADACTNKAISLEYLNRDKEAEVYYKKAAEKYDEEMEKLNTKAKSLFDSEQYEESINLFDQVLKFAPNNPFALYHKALSLFKLENYKESLSIFNRFLEDDPANVKALFYHGRASLSLKQYEESITFFNKILELNENNSECWYFKGNALYHLGNIKQAEYSYKKALLLLEKSNEKNEIIKPLEMLRLIYSNHIDFLNINEAVSISKKLVESDNNNNRFKLMLVEDLIKSNNFDDAEKIITNISNSDLENKSFKKVYQFLRLCLNFMNSNKTNAYNNITFLNYFQEFDDQPVDSKFWNFNGIKHVIDNSPLLIGKKRTLLSIIEYYQTDKNKEVVLGNFNNLLSSTTVELQNVIKFLKRYVLPGAIAIVLFIGFVIYPNIVPILFPSGPNDDSNSGISIPKNVIMIAGYNDPAFLLANGSIFYYNNETSKMINSFKENQPYDIAFNSVNKKIYILNKNLNNVSVIDPGSNKTQQIDINGNPIDILYNHNNNTMYVTTTKDQPKYNSLYDISVVDGDTNNVINTIPLESLPTDIAYNSNNNMIYVVQRDSSTVSVIDGNTNKIINEISVGGKPTDIAYNPNNNMIYVANEYSDSISVISGDSQISSNTYKHYKQDIHLSDFSSPVGLDIDINNNMIYVVQRDLSTVSVIDGNTNKIINEISVGGKPTDIAYNPNNNTMYVTNMESDTVSVIDGDTNNVINTIP
ncbi:MAG TPA: tetratricopeptide repeat protein, partial [Nitrososphaeraceae archaeon]|nr:tetratricopeptide repeat protein [Nitrososphaeraceae archaeon]